MSNQSLIEEAMALGLEERIGLAEALWQSISEGLPSGDEREAIIQASQREAQLIAGAVAGRSHDDVMLAARRTIGCD